MKRVRGNERERERETTRVFNVLLVFVLTSIFTKTPNRQVFPFSMSPYYDVSSLYHPAQKQFNTGTQTRQAHKRLDQANTSTSIIFHLFRDGEENELSNYYHLLNTEQRTKLYYFAREIRRDRNRQILNVSELGREREKQRDSYRGREGMTETETETDRDIAIVMQAKTIEFR